MNLLLLLFLLSLAAAQELFPTSSPPTTLSLDTGGLTDALDRNVYAIQNLTQSNEKVVGQLNSTISSMVASNDKNVAEIVQAANKLTTDWETSIKPSINATLHTWDTSVKYKIDDVTAMVRSMLSKWDNSIKPSVDSALTSVDGIDKSAKGALERWDSSLQPLVRSAFLAASVKELCASLILC